jgi:SpoVK/Ycf46/Vps4 family AAA+-type ATPase
MIDEIDKFFELLDEKEEREKEKVKSAANSEMNSNIVIVKEGSGDDKFKKSGSSAISTCNAAKKSNDLTRGQILSIMDGILESKGRFIICTANDTSKIDSTFKRPGRMDEIIHFSKCDSMMMNQLMDLFYDGCVNREYSKEELDRFKGLEYRLSPSELNKICFNNIHSREEGEKQLLALL